MAYAGRTLLILILGARLARAAGPCEEGRDQSGLALAPAAGALAVAMVDVDSPAAASGLEAGDVVVQVNDTVPRSCAEYARAVRDARRAHRALLLLVRRASGEVPLALGAAAWNRPVAAAAQPPPPTLEPPTVRALVEKPRPQPLPPEVNVSVAEVRAGFDALARAAERPASLPAYQQEVERVGRQVESLAARGAAPPDMVEGMRTVLAYYEAAGVAWANAEAERDRTRQPRRIPFPVTGIAPYFSDSQAAVAIDRFPFLRATVDRDPTAGMLGIESAGRWRPIEARALLWEHGREELTRLSVWLAAGPS